jgi:hypothetical protein
VRYEQSVEQLEQDEGATDTALVETMFKISSTTFGHSGHAHAPDRSASSKFPVRAANRAILPVV